MLVDILKLSEVMGVWMLVRGIVIASSARAAIRIVGVIHTRAEIRIIKGLILMVQAEIVCQFLTHYETSPSRRIISWRVEICVVNFGDSLRDVLAAGNPNLSYAQPTVIAVFGITDFDATSCGTAVLWIGSPRDFEKVQYARLIPVADCLIKVRIPCGGYVVARFDGEGVARAGKMIATPRVIGRRDCCQGCKNK